jgi:enoyl-CoA hydratase
MVGRHGQIGVITLNRGEVLNSLNLTMIRAMQAQLQRWAQADQVKAVIIRAGEGRAFCAGGDLRFTYDRYQAHDGSMMDFFREEYQLNRFIYHFPKPYLALLDGITMGGGVGISIHGSHRIATDRLLFAMPETGIGFFPDVGGSYFLPRLSGQIGFYLGLTGAKLECDDCVALGIAHQKVPRENIPKLIAMLVDCEFDQANNSRAAVTQVIEQFSVEVNPETTLLAKQAMIEESFSRGTMEKIIQHLQQQKDAFSQATALALLKKSPTSLKVTLRALQEGEDLDFDACMTQNYQLASRFLQGHDFMEGIRAVIIDKDHVPRWNPNLLEEVTEEEVEKYFTPVTEESL